MPDYEDFDLDRSTSQAWHAFSERLAEVVSVMDDSADLKIGCLASPQAGEVPFVRFHCGADRVVFAEAASNAVLAESFQLGADQLELMESLGWQPPTATGAYPTANFWVADAQERSARLADLAVGALRDVFGVQHPVFLQPDQLAEVLTPRGESPSAVSEFEAEDIMAIVPRDREHLDGLVESELVQLFGHQPLRDDEGDFALRVGSTMVFVRSTRDAREVIVFSALVHDVEGRSRAVEVLNDLNAEARYVRFQLIRDRVFLTLSVLAHPFVPAHLHQAIKAVSDVGDGIDEELAAKLRGRTTFGSSDHTG